MFVLLPTDGIHAKYFKLRSFISLIIFYAIIYTLFDSSHFNETITNPFNFNMTDLQEIFTKFISKLYTSVIIQSTVGFGDIVPRSSVMKIIISTQALSTLIIALI